MSAMNAEAEKLEAEGLAMTAEILEMNNKLADLRAPSDSEAVQTLKGDAAGSAKKPLVVGQSINSFTQEAGKMSSIAWMDNEHILTVLQDGKIVVSNGMVAKGGALRWFRSQNTWLMTSQFSPDNTKLAVAGLDNLVTVHNVDLDPEKNDDAAKPFKICEKHAGYIGAMKWVNNDTIITGSGDKTILRWDLTQDAGLLKDPVNTFIGHDGDVGALSTIPDDMNCFLSGSADGTVKLWDARVPHGNGCVNTFHVGALNDEDGAEQPRYGINCVKFMKGTNCFATGSDDCWARIFDLRAQAQVTEFEPSDESSSAIKSIATSKSHRLLYTGLENGTVRAMDVLTGKEVWKNSNFNGEVSGLELSPDGNALAGCARASGDQPNFAIFI